MRLDERTSEMIQAHTEAADIRLRAYQEAREPIELVEGEIAAVSLQPGDRLAIMTEGRLSREQASMIEAMLEAWAPGVPTLVLEGGLRLAVVRADPEGDRGRNLQGSPSRDRAPKLAHTPSGFGGGGRAQARGFLSSAVEVIRG